jgi:predicted XRE-type DNA-binding protein
MPRITDETAVVRGSGNVFADIGVPDPELAQAKAGICHKIYATIRDRGLTQTQAAKLMGVDQPKVSEITRGRVRSYTIDRLLGYLGKLGYGIRIDYVALPVKQDPAGRTIGRETIRAGKPKRAGRIKVIVSAARKVRPARQKAV